MSQNSSRREAMRAQQQAEEAAARRRKIVGIVAGVLVIAIIAAVVIWAVNRDKGSEEATGPQAKPPSANMKTGAYTVYPKKAKKNAPVVTVFEDPQCPSCKDLETSNLGHAIQALASSGDIELRWQILTFLDDNLRNDSSSRAARAIAAADMVGKLAPYHNTVYANQPEEEGTGYTDEQLRDDFAAQAGIKGEDLATFQKYYDNNTTKEFAEKAADTGLQTGTNLTKKFSSPFVTVNGQPWEDWQMMGDANQAQLLDAIKKAAK